MRLGQRLDHKPGRAFHHGVNDDGIEGAARKKNGAPRLQRAERLRLERVEQRHAEGLEVAHIPSDHGEAVHGGSCSNHGVFVHGV